MPESPTYPKKLFYRIQEVADIVGVEPYVLRYWETKFPMLKPEKDGNDQRRYRQKDIELLLRIRALLYEEKYTIAGAVERLQTERASGSGLHRVERAAPAPPAPADGPEEAGAGDLFAGEEAEPGAGPELDPEKLARIRRVKEELGLMKRELEQWRDELG